MSSRRHIALIAIALFVVLTAPESEGQRRRRAVAPPSSAAPGACVEYKAVKPGMKASYLATAPGGNVTYTITYISDSKTETHTTQKVQTPQATADAETRATYEKVPGATYDLRALKHLWTKVVTPVPFIGSTTVETDIAFVPSLVLGPMDGYCPGVKWRVPPSTETITVKSIAGTMVQTQTTIEVEGEVLGTNVPVATSIGTFDCIQLKTYSIVNGEPQLTIAWNSIEHAVTVKQEAYDAGGNVVTSVIITDLKF
ncbi:MAG TPA: hypothetical protein VF618_14360 [Thermoanaerobaculia bacterium]